jgi:hypothetical protein
VERFTPYGHLKPRPTTRTSHDPKSGDGGEMAPFDHATLK